jgi:hypothetical protein
LGPAILTPERYRTRTAGVSFTNLNVHGYGSPTDYEKTVGNLSLDYFGNIKCWLAIGKKSTKIQMLRNLEGLVESGEMLVVLGRPGRQAVPIISLDQHSVDNIKQWLFHIFEDHSGRGFYIDDKYSTKAFSQR